MTVGELKEFWDFLEDKTLTVHGYKNKQEWERFQSSILSDEDTDWDLLYPYCAGTSASDYTEFTAEIPAQYLAETINDLISSFDGVDGDEHRVIFWFDN